MSSVQFSASTAVASSVPFDPTGTSFTSTDVQDAIVESSHLNTAIEVSATASATAPTGTDTLINTMTITPTPGTYIAWFSTDITSPTSSAAISVSLYVGGVQDASSLRKIIPFSGGTLTSGSGRGSLAINRTVTVTTGQTVEVRWSTSSSGPTCASRVLTLLRIA